ncbi:membrane protein [Microbacterium phage Haunter]|nr:membrane protein [Microbacterium phage Haunter]WIC90108.1 membrane protein [Microbacterium phage Tedro]
MDDWFWALVVGVLGGAIAVGSAWAVDKTKWERHRRPVARPTDLTQTRIDPERNGQRVERFVDARNPDSESHRRKTFSKKRRGGTEAHMSQPRKFW